MLDKLVVQRYCCATIIIVQLICSSGGADICSFVMTISDL